MTFNSIVLSLRVSSITFLLIRETEIHRYDNNSTSSDGHSNIIRELEIRIGDVFFQIFKINPNSSVIYELYFFKLLR